MAIVKTRAITLKTTNYSDTSQVLIFLAGAHGIVHALARGSKRPKSPFQGAIDVMTLNEIVYYEKRSDLHQLAEVDQITTFPGLRSSLARAGAGAYACELIGQLARDSHHPKELFDLLHDSLYTIEVSSALPQTLFAFEIAALRLAGYMPMLDSCVSCGGDWNSNGTGAFSPLLGGLLCTACNSDSQRTVPVAAGVVAIAQALAGGTLKPERLRVTPAQYQGLRTILDRFVETTLNIRLKSRKFLTQK